MIRLEGLSHAWKKHKAHGVYRILFTFTTNLEEDGTYRPYTFDCLFVGAPQPPYKLLIATHKTPIPWCHIYEVEEIAKGVLATETYLGDDYGPLLQALGIGGHGGTVKLPIGNIVKAASNAAARQNVREWVPPQNIPPSLRRNVEESEKIYFYGWLDHQTENAGRHVTAANLDKTARLLGLDIARFCKTNNISSRWTDRPSPASREANKQRPLPPGWSR
ncbi:DUF6037 family protein [Actinotignum sp. GS-2025f]|uniref:DUF6037 family protein n=1 Tax=Actinotignum TaxID=1653174 RepID=UPI00254C0196|nr:DUF6037 family protein [Actinotignum timonense]MDK8283237.1 DUF6037 family protein [Actinotignum timonense]